MLGNVVLVADAQVAAELALRHEGCGS